MGLQGLLFAAFIYLSCHCLISYCSCLLPCVGNFSSDFSVSTRLLPDTPSHNVPSSYLTPTYPSDNYVGNPPPPPPPPNGWQFLLPSDMGTARGHPHSTGQYEPAPNASLSLIPPPPYQSLAYCNGYPTPKLSVTSLPSPSAVDGGHVHHQHLTMAPPLHHKFDCSSVGYGGWSGGASSSSASARSKPLPPVGTLTSPSSVSYPDSPSYNNGKVLVLLLLLLVPLILLALLTYQLVCFRLRCPANPIKCALENIGNLKFKLF